MKAKSTSDERSAGNRHATFCGSRERVTAPGDPVRERPAPAYSETIFRSRHLHEADPAECGLGGDAFLTVVIN